MNALFNQQQLQPLFADLAEQGLVLATAVSVRQLPDSIWLDKPVKDAGTLLLLGHGGRLFWQQFMQSKPNTADPVDDFSRRVSARVLQQHLPGIHREALFPSQECPVNLMALGKAVGWHRPSPLGMGINAQYGLWSAYRALWWLDAEFVESDDAVPLAANDVCAGCVTQDCLQACPAEALRLEALPNLRQCADFRLAHDSDCATTCVARMACPVAVEHRYTPEQMAYHYDLTRSQIHLFSSGALVENA